MKNKIKLSILITTMNEGIYRVKEESLPQLIGVDEIIISHQITDEKIKPEIDDLGKNIKYFYMFEKGLSKNRNNALNNATGDICYICDDDLNFIDGFQNIIKQEYRSNNIDIITFQAENENGKKHFNVKTGKHNRFSVLKIWSWGITFRRKSIIESNLIFNENFGLGTQYPVGEENIFLTDCYKKGLFMNHCNASIVIHKDESSGILYKDRKDLIIARIKVFKKIFGFIGGFIGIFYFTILHYKYYKNDFSIIEFFILSFKSLINEK